MTFKKFIYEEKLSSFHERHEIQSERRLRFIEKSFKQFVISIGNKVE
jgi:hypothetical protein